MKWKTNQVSVPTTLRDEYAFFRSHLRLQETVPNLQTSKHNKMLITDLSNQYVTLRVLCFLFHSFILKFQGAELSLKDANLK